MNQHQGEWQKNCGTPGARGKKHCRWEPPNEPRSGCGSGPATAKRNQTKEGGQSCSTSRLAAHDWPPELRCQGRLHCCDLLELKALRIKHLPERAQRAGDCAQSVQATCATPKLLVHCCHVGKRGFDAPKEDPQKMSMDCGLALRLACRGKMSDDRALASSKDGGLNQRASARHDD